MQAIHIKKVTGILESIHKVGFTERGVLVRHLAQVCVISITKVV
jgi:hypothetical protein